MLRLIGAVRGTLRGGVLAAGAILVLFASACGSKTHAHAPSRGGSICPGNYPIKVNKYGSTMGPWDKWYGFTVAVKCYDKEANAAKAGFYVSPPGVGK